MANLENWEDAIDQYVKAIGANLERGNYTEHTHRPALKQLLETVCPIVVATNEPKRIECGAPDFIVTHGNSPWGYIEAKDVDVSLDEALKSEQLKRYLGSLSNLILTDYLEFRWYVNGILREPIVRIAIPTERTKLQVDVKASSGLKNLLLGFLNANVRTVKNSVELAKLLASLAKTLRAAIVSAYAVEEENEVLHAQLKSIQDVLIPDIAVRQFADMYAQTITYGLFASRCYCLNADDFSREKASYFVPKTNPFLRKFFSELTGPDLDTRYAWVVDDIVDLLSKSDMESIMKDFGKTSGRDDPVVHFYETFLSSYDPDLREKLGVFYTPTPVVAYIVRSVDEILKKEFKCNDGLADSSILVLDPACGTGTFLYSLVDLISTRMVGQEGSWNDYVSQKLLSRMFGFELLMAPYVISHLKLSLELQNSGFKFNTEQRLGVYLTNSLEEGLKKSEVIFAKWLSDEANAAAEIKRDKPIMIVFGNPPYSGHSANKGAWIRKLVHDYRMLDGKDIGEKQIKWLQDDYVKFIRFGQWRIEQTGQGIVAFITNHAYLDNPTFRAMRKNLLNHFDSIYILNLHGNMNRRRITPQGEADENVFDIRQGVSIVFMIKAPQPGDSATLQYAERWGSRESKYSYLRSNTIGTTDWEKLSPKKPNFYFVHIDDSLNSEYEKGYPLVEIFPKNNVGFVTARDNFAIDFEQLKLEKRIGELRDPNISDQEMISRYKLHDTTSWSLSAAREAIKLDKNWKQPITKCLYRPFDVRYIFFSKTVLERPVLDSSGPLLAGGNLAFVSMRQVVQDDVDYSHFAVSHYPADARCFKSNKGIVQVFPIFAYGSDGKTLIPNIGRTFRDHFCRILQREWSDKPEAGKMNPYSVLCYVTAVTFSMDYRLKYSDLLRRDFPRIPIIADKECIERLIELGDQIVKALTLEKVVTSAMDTKFPIEGTNLVGSKFPRYEKESQRVLINGTQYFEGVPESAWEYELGGRRVCAEWLRARRGHPLTFDEKSAYQEMVAAILDLVRLSESVDVVLNKHWNDVAEKAPVLGRLPT